MVEDTPLPFSLPSVQRKKITAAFDGGRMTSDGGVMLLAIIENRLGIANRLAPLIADPRNPAFVTHSVADILRARMLAIACGYEDGDDLDHLRTDPGFKRYGRPMLAGPNRSNHLEPQTTPSRNRQIRQAIQAFRPVHQLVAVPARRLELHCRPGMASLITTGSAPSTCVTAWP